MSQEPGAASPEQRAQSLWSPVPSLEPALAGRVFGQYRVLEKIGQGGMGAVFKAEDLALKRAVALKILQTGPTDDPRLAERFQREARCLARLSHPNLLHVYNVGSDGELHYFAMELLDGVTLTELIHRRQRLPAAEVLALMGALLSALHYIHRQGITHRDVKSGNIMICAGRPVLMDFGLAKEELASGLTSAGAVLGTPEYMAPEQAEGQPCGPATDIYSLGVVMFEALTGQVPFIGRSALSIIRQHLETPPPRLEARLPGADPRLGVVVARALAKTPAERYPDCRAFAAELLPLGPSTELTQLAGATTAPLTSKDVEGERVRERSVALRAEDNAPPSTLTLSTAAAPPASAAPWSRWFWVALGFCGVLVLGVILLRRPRLNGRGTPTPWQLVRAEAGPHAGQELRWQFRAGPAPTAWRHVIQLRQPDGTWAPPRELTHEEFLREYPKLGFAPAKE